MSGENTETTMHPASNAVKKLPDGVKVKLGRCLLEILILGHNKDKDKIDKMAMELKAQMGDKKIVRKVRGLYRLVADGQSLDEAKSWLLENANAKYILFTPPNHKIESDFVKKAITRINEFEAKFGLLKLYGIQMTKKTKPIEVKPEEVKVEE